MVGIGCSNASSMMELANSAIFLHLLVWWGYGQGYMFEGFVRAYILAYTL